MVGDSCKEHHNIHDAINTKFHNLNYKTMTDLTMILLALGMVAVFMGPFFVISAIKDKKEAKQKQEENEEK